MVWLEMLQFTSSCLDVNEKTVTVHYSGGKLIAYIVVLIFTEHYRVKMWKFIIMGTSGIVSDLHDYYCSSVVTFHQEYYMINIF